VTGAEIDLKKLSACIHCGLCLEACPTYRETGEEMSSPRGRLYLMRNYTEGTIAASDPEFAEHELSCLVCRACETACPSGVEFGVLMEQTRSLIVNEQKKSAVNAFIYTRLLRSKSLLKLLQVGTAVFSKLGLAKLGSALISPSTKLGAALSLLPKDVPFPVSRKSLYQSNQPNGKRVGLLLGCVGDVFTSQVNDATIKVLNELGYDVDIMPTITCCGALAAHAGYLDVTKALARQNLEMLKDDRLDYAISNIAGCGAMLKEYESLSSQTDQAETAIEVRAKTFDINEFLYRFHADDLRTLLHSNIFSGKRIAYQAPCHLLHGQRIVDEPLKLLQILPGVEAFSLDENELCCGSAGSYNIEHPEMAESLRKRKMQIISDAEPDIVATANAGCMLQLSKESDVPVRHVIELLAEALAIRHQPDGKQETTGPK
jgi:glycolate oxidase iron-sulfur subunit